MQNLAVIGFSLGDLNRRMQAVVPQEHHTKLDAGMEQLSEELVRVETDLRALIIALEHGSVSTVPVVEAIESEIADFEKRSPASVVFTVSGNVETKTDSQRIAIQSVTRAALANIAKHASATRSKSASEARPDDHPPGDRQRGGLRFVGTAEEGPVRPRRHEGARRTAGGRVRDLEPSWRSDQDHRHA